MGLTTKYGCASKTLIGTMIVTTREQKNVIVAQNNLANLGAESLILTVLTPDFFQPLGMLLAVFASGIIDS